MICFYSTMPKGFLGKGENDLPTETAAPSSGSFNPEEMSEGVPLPSFLFHTE